MRHQASRSQQVLPRSLTDAPKTIVSQFDNFVVTGGTIRCNYDNLRCHRTKLSNWRPSVFNDFQSPNTYSISHELFAGSLQWRHNERDGVSNHQPHDCLLNRLFRRSSKNIKALRHCPLWREFPAQRASKAVNVSIWWRHHDCQGSAICQQWHDRAIIPVPKKQPSRL